MDSTNAASDGRVIHRGFLFEVLEAPFEKFLLRCKVFFDQSQKGSFDNIDALILNQEISINLDMRHHKVKSGSHCQVVSEVLQSRNYRVDDQVSSIRVVEIEEGLSDFLTLALALCIEFPTHVSAL